MVLLIHKNFQFVKLSQEDLGIKNPASRIEDWRGHFSDDEKLRPAQDAKAGHCFRLEGG